VKPPGLVKPPGPPEPKPAGDTLAEVERALSVLHGRHPEAVRAERETQAALETKRASSEAHVARIAKEEKRKWILRGALGVTGLALIAFAWSAYARRASRAAAIEASLAPVVAPYLGVGFSRVEAPRFAAETVALDAQESTCFVAFSSRAPGDGALRVERPSGALDGSESIAWCTCGMERSTVTLGTPASGGGLGVLRVAAAEVGGDHGLYFMSPRARLVATPDECSGASLDAWIDQGHAPVRADEKPIGEPLHARLQRNGFTPAGAASAELPFAVVPGVPDTCILAWSTAAEDALGLRLSGGERPLSDVKGALGYCADKPKSVTVWRKGRGELLAFRVAAGRIGGTHGLREAAARLGFEAVVAWTARDDLAWNASSVLRASGIPAPEIAVSTDGSPQAHARLLGLSMDGAMVLADAQGVGSACEPPLTRSSEHAVCTQTTALGWHVVGSVGKAGIAQATFPFWMHGFDGVTDAAALPVELSMLKLGRRLVAEGFEATTLAGVTETREGAIVTGRAGDDAIVAMGLTHDAPWVAPCSEGDVSTWTLDGDPASLSSSRPETPGVIALAPGAQAKLVCGSARGEARDRKTVVFRHPADPSPAAPR